MTKLPNDEFPSELRAPLTELLLSVADDKLVLGHRNADWTGLGPILEEDIAFSSLAQDELAHAAALYELLAPFTGRDANQLAYGRKAQEYRCAAIVEVPDHFDWAAALVRQFFCDHFDILRLARLSRSGWAPLAALGTRLAAEERIHIGHADGWMVRLGHGGDEARGRVQAALDQLAPLALGLLEPPEGLERLEAAGIYPPGPDDMFEEWSSALENVTDDGGLRLELHRPAHFAPGGRRGRHTEEFAGLLAEMTEVYQVEPEAAW